jgi:demethylmenaquinone methyltransferase/2-methoxy-6-polyprenyl-1,4-benzoquinol methylase
MIRATLKKESTQVSAMFNEVAHGYDRTRAVLWFGQARRWGRITARCLALAPGRTVLDVACGTGTSSRYLAESGAKVTGCDFSPGMLAVARTRVPDVEFLPGDALDLPFESETFDAATISFGLRNVADTHRALTEMRRVVRPGGRLAVCEYTHPPHWLARATADGYLRRVAPLIARWLSSNPHAYRYLADSIAAWPGQAELAATIHRAGWTKVAWRNVSAGLVAVHRATRG